MICITLHMVSVFLKIELLFMLDIFSFAKTRTILFSSTKKQAYIFSLLTFLFWFSTLDFNARSPKRNLPGVAISLWVTLPQTKHWASTRTTPPWRPPETAHPWRRAENRSSGYRRRLLWWRWVRCWGLQMHTFPGKG